MAKRNYYIPTEQLKLESNRTNPGYLEYGKPTDHGPEQTKDHLRFFRSGPFDWIFVYADDQHIVIQSYWEGKAEGYDTIFQRNGDYYQVVKEESSNSVEGALVLWFYAYEFGDWNQVPKNEEPDHMYPKWPADSRNRGGMITIPAETAKLAVHLMALKEAATLELYIQQERKNQLLTFKVEEKLASTMHDEGLTLDADDATPVIEELFQAHRDLQAIRCLLEKKGQVKG